MQEYASKLIPKYIGSLFIMTVSELDIILTLDIIKALTILFK